MAFRPRDLADRMAGRRKPDDGYLRETFTLPRDKARSRARDFLNRYPKAAYMSSVESWRELPSGEIEFTMRRLPSADWARGVKFRMAPFWNNLKAGEFSWGVVT